MQTLTVEQLIKKLEGVKNKSLPVELVLLGFTKQDTSSKFIDDVEELIEEFEDKVELVVFKY